MAVLYTLTFRGNPEDLLAISQKRTPFMMEIPRPGLISFTLARADDGIILVEQWETEEQAEASFHHPNHAKAQALHPMPQPEIRKAQVLVSVTP